MFLKLNKLILNCLQISKPIIRVHYDSKIVFVPEIIFTLHLHFGVTIMVHIS